MISEKSLQKAEEKAIELLERFEIKSPPIPIKEVVEKLGLKIIPYDLSDGVSGLLVVDNDIGTIGFNPSNSRVRQRFTIAHELGHYVLHCDSKSMVFIDRDFIVKYRSEKKYSNNEIKQEQEANAFAAALLMPKNIIRSELDKKENRELPEVEFIEAFAKVFDVSIPAMTFRLSNLDLYL